MPVIEGRNFSSGDGALDDPVAIVNDIFARRYFSPTAVGHHVRDAAGASYEIVGVVRSGRHRTLQEQPEPMIFFPLSQRHLGQLHLVVRTDGEAGPVLQPVEALLTRVDERVQVIRTMTFEQHLAEALSLDRFATATVLGCAGAALLLATLGVYGVLADAVRRRTAEIGLRVALGARRSQVLTLVFGEGVRLTGAGIACGVLASILLKRVADAFVHGLPPLDLISLAAVPAVLTVVVLAAAAVPMVRALRISPTIALRAE
jgi:hypothetical protein